MDLFELSGLLISTKFRDSVGPLLNKQATQYDQFHISKIYIEKQVPNLLTNLIAEFDLNFPQIDKVVKAALKPMTFLGKNKVEYEELLLVMRIKVIIMTTMIICQRTWTIMKKRQICLEILLWECMMLESEGDDEFYDAEDPVDAMMTGEDLSGASDDGDDDDDEDDDGDDDIDDMSSELSAIDSDLDGGDNADDIEMEIEVDPYDDERALRILMKTHLIWRISR